MRNEDPRLLSAGITRNSTFEADNGALREFVDIWVKNKICSLFSGTGQNTGVWRRAFGGVLQRRERCQPACGKPFAA